MVNDQQRTVSYRPGMGNGLTDGGRRANRLFRVSTLTKQGELYRPSTDGTIVPKSNSPWSEDSYPHWKVLCSPKSTTYAQSYQKRNTSFLTLWIRIRSGLRFLYHSSNYKKKKTEFSQIHQNEWKRVVNFWSTISTPRCRLWPEKLKKISTILSEKWKFDKHKLHTRPSRCWKKKSMHFIKLENANYKPVLVIIP